MFSTKLNVLILPQSPNVFEACKKYDRESGSAPILNSIFVTGKISDVKDAPVMEEPKYVKEIIHRLSALGSSHPLSEYVVKLESKVAESEKAISSYDAIAKEVAALKVLEEISKRKLREQYRLNYLHAEERLGKKMPNCFSRLSGKQPNLLML
jgi:hypothetical protein